MSLGEGVQLGVFGILSLLAIGFAVGVVFAPNIVYSGFLLAGVFLSMAGLYLLLNADFVAAAQVLIYVGAVNVLILFAIMLVNRRYVFKPLQLGWLRNGATAAVCLGLFALLATAITQTPWPEQPIAAISSVEVIGGHFFSDYLLPFEVASVLLLMALVGAIVLARRDFIIGALPEDLSGGEQSLLERYRPLIAADVEDDTEAEAAELASSGS
ncbi:MAG: NADH-quinone oxidoreductase subunit J [Synechococcaceae cyanobacterium SM2_3_2]|nr:NADH-quinone oxidoreductase subunit J [Synechococcaceae cyanobacterium SM2_3_2]